MYKKESLELLKTRINIVDVIGSHLDLKPSGATYKALCPFHDEKSPSFVVQKGDSHYHCFGCGAHGDAIQFLMTHLRMSFVEAIESLAQRFQVHLDHSEEKINQGPNKKQLSESLEHACELYHYCLLHTQEGHDALQYLYHRGVDLDFIRQFKLGLAPRTQGVLRKVLHSRGVSDDLMSEAGLITLKDGQWRDFFYDRITIPIHQSTGSIIGFSARKYREETFGGKYVNTSETALFKKSKVLFGLNYSRRRIAKERKAIVVEGQIDALRLIHCGLNLTVAGQGTAFGEDHARELVDLGINQVYLALDPDNAGQEAAAKIGQLFQKAGVEVWVVNLPIGKDPDGFLREHGPEAFIKLLTSSRDYLTFLVHHRAKQLNLNTPAGKQELVRQIATQIRLWDHEVMIFESLRKLARITQVPEEAVGIGKTQTPNLFIKRVDYVGNYQVDPHRVIETDLLRWLFLVGQSSPELVGLAQRNLKNEDFHVPVCQRFYQTYMESPERDMLSLAVSLQDAEGQQLLSDITNRRVNRERATQHFKETVFKILERNWMEKREAIKMRIQSGDCTDDQAFELTKQFEELRRNPPVLKE
jgi:DNA primase